MMLKFCISLLLTMNKKARFDIIHQDDAQYHVCNIMQWLLRLSNDVEENPGPTINDIVDCT